MLDGTTPPAWVLELVLPGSRKPVSGPSDKRMEEVRGAPQPQQNLDVVFERVQNPTTPATLIQQQSSSSGSSCTSPPDHSQPAPLTARTTSAVEALPTDPLTARNTSDVEAPPTARTTSAVAPPSAHHNQNEHAKISMTKSDVPLRSGCTVYQLKMCPKSWRSSTLASACPPLMAPLTRLLTTTP